MHLFTNSPETIAEGVTYLRVLSFSFVFMGFAQIFVSALRSVGKVVFPSVIYVVSLLVNVFLNATFIFGLFGAPKLGVVGVALGTVTARAVEAVLCLIYSAGSSPIKAFRGPNGLIFQRRGKKRKPIKKLFSNSIPVMIGNEERVYGVEKDNIQSDLNKYVSQQIAILIK